MKEGKGILSLHGYPITGAAKEEYKKYDAIVKMIDGKLNITLEETSSILPTPVELTSSSKSIENISLSTMDGEKVSDNVRFRVNERLSAEMFIEQPGEFIATVKLKSGDTVRYGIIATEKESGVYYEIQSLFENTTEVYKEIAEYKGGYTIRGNDSMEIADVTRIKDSKNLELKFTGKKAGTFDIDYDRTINHNYCGDSKEDGCTSEWDGLIVTVKTLGPIVNVFVRANVSH